MKARTDAEWLAALKSSGDEQSAALEDLRVYLLRAATYSLHRNRGSLSHVSPADIAHLADDCAQDSLLALLRHLHTFRGESRFTTWAYAFAVNAALVAARRERWKRVPLDQVLDSTEPYPWSLTGHGRASIDPNHRLLQEQLLATLREAIDHSLTERQRQALKAVVFEGVPLDEVARLWNSNRNAIYKLLHDARRKLKAYLEQRGFGASDIDGLSTTVGKI